MAAKGQTLLTFADTAKLRGKRPGMVAEVMTLHNPILQDMMYRQMNEGTIHKESSRGSLPAPYYRKANQGIPAGKTELQEHSFTAAHFESKSQIDLKVASRGGDGMIAFNRWNQAKGHIIGMSHEHAALTFYGSPSDDPRKVPGLADIYSTLDPAASPTAKQVIDCGGTGSDQTSIYLLAWGENSFFGVYPNDTQAGLKRTDYGKVKIQALDENAAAAEFWGWEEVFELDHGLVAKDYRQGSRACNIDTTALRDGADPTDLIDVMISLQAKLDSLENGKLAYYVNRTIHTALRKQVRADVQKGGGLTYSNHGGVWILEFDGIPVRRCDSLLSSEEALDAAP